MIFHGWCADGGDASATPDGQLEDTWTNASTCHRNAAAKWTGETWFFEKGCQDPQPVQTSDDPLDFSSRQDPKGILAGVASRILMKIFYGARFARWDLLKVVTKLATMVTKWTTACDAALLRLMRYIKATVDWVLVGYVGDSVSDLSLQLYADADFAGDRPSYKSTSGTLLCLHGPLTYMPLAGRTKKQGCVSHSTPEAEIVSLDSGMRSLALPALDIWEKVLGRKVELVALEDNEATLQIVKTGKNRHCAIYLGCMASRSLGFTTSLSRRG